MGIGLRGLVDIDLEGPMGIGLGDPMGIGLGGLVGIGLGGPMGMRMCVVLTPLLSPVQLFDLHTNIAYVKSRCPSTVKHILTILIHDCHICKCKTFHWLGVQGQKFTPKGVKKL